MSRRIIPSAFRICTSGNGQTGLIGSHRPLGNARCLDGVDPATLKPTRFFNGRNWEEAVGRAGSLRAYVTAIWSSSVEFYCTIPLDVSVRAAA
jgi:hypothetical protein